MTDDPREDVRFLVMAKYDNYARPHFVMAKDGNTAILKVIEANTARGIHVLGAASFEVFMLGAEELAPVTPDLKHLAWQYWSRGALRGTDGLRRGTVSMSEFENEVWDEYGVDGFDDD